MEEQIFTKIYDQNLWGSGSGPGSNPINAEPYLKLLQSYLDDPKFVSIVDLGCGDWQLMKTLRIPDSKAHIGFDLVKSVINTNIKNYQKDNINFNHIHKLADLKNQKGDLLIVKDVLQHSNNQEIKYFIKEILPNFKYALITNDYFSTNNNSEISTGLYRTIDLESEPFNMSSIKTLLDYSAHGVLKRVYLY
ncbi:MAG: class I SAM-dependent methyltransferase [Candidatus Rickettsia vulgarisii]